MNRLIIFMMIVPAFSFGQSADEIKRQIRLGSECLKNEGANCYGIFDAALEMAKSLPDSLRLHYHENVIRTYGNIGTHQDEWFAYSKQALSLSRQLNSGRYEWKFLSAILQAKQFAGDYDLMEAYADSCFLLAESLGDFGLQFESLIEMSYAKQHRGDLKTALNILLRAKHIGEVELVGVQLNRLNLNLGSLYARNNDLVLAEAYFLEAYQGYLAGDDTAYAMVAHVNWCNTLIGNGKPQEAVEELPLNIEYFKENKAMSRVVFPMAQLGRAHMDLGDFSEARKVLLEAVTICDRFEIVQQGAYCKLLLSRSELALGMKKEALIHSHEAYEHHRSRGVSEEYLSAYERYGLALKANEDYKKAYEVMEDYRAAKDSMFNSTKAAEIARIQEQLESEKKELMLCAQENEIASLEEQGKTIRTRNTGLVIGLLLTSLLAYLLVKRKSTLVKLKESENEKLNLILESKNRQLTEKALHLAQKNELLGSLKKDLEAIKGEDAKDEIRDLSNKIRFDKQIDQNWEQFTKAFTETKGDFFKKLSERHPKVSKNDLRLSALLSMNLGSKEIASILNISDLGVKKARYRLRKRLELSREQSIEKYLASL